MINLLLLWMGIGYWTFRLTCNHSLDKLSNTNTVILCILYGPVIWVLALYYLLFIHIPSQFKGKS